MRIAEDAGYDFDLLKGVIAVNEEQFERVADKIGRPRPAGPSTACTVAVWGLTFKARTDDLRDSPALAIIERLLARGASVAGLRPDGVDDRRSHAASRSCRDAVRGLRGRRRCSPC